MQSDTYIGLNEPIVKSSKGPISLPISYLILMSVYTVTLLLGWLFLNLFSFVESTLLQLFIVNMLCTVVMFIFSLIFQNSSIYDPYVSVANLAISWYWWSLAGDQRDTHKILAMVAISLFCVRHLIFYFRAWPGMGWEDARFLSTRRRFKDNVWVHWLISFSVYHMLTTAIFFLGLLPLYYIVFTNYYARLWLLIIGFAMCCAGIITEVVMFWFGLYVMALGVDLGLWWTIIGPVLMFALLFVIRIPYHEIKVMRWTGMRTEDTL